jgi:hypothetical protein
MRTRWAGALALAVMLMAAGARPAAGQWQVESKDGKTNIRFGFLAQPQVESIETPDGTARSTNLFLRRLRLIFAGKVAEKWTFFLLTDSPNLGRSNPDKAGNPTATKEAGFVYLQDAYFTFNQSDVFKVDVGMIMTPLGHNHNQSAASLLPIDYGPYSFAESTVMGTRMGRDYGVQLRGYPLGQHLEYRLGVFQGHRGVEARNDLRIAGRAVWYPFTPDTGFFYTGTFHGTKRVVGIGGSFDKQEGYGQYGADVFVEQPLAGTGQAVTFQANWMRYDGGAFVPSLLKHDAYEIEAAVHLAKGRVSPFVQYAAKDFTLASAPDQTHWQAGVAWWMAGHQRSLKVSAGRQHTANQRDRTLVLAQLQIYFY